MGEPNGAGETGSGSRPKDDADDLVINFRGVAARPRPEGSFDILLQTTRGDIPSILHPCEGQEGVALFIGGGQELKGPADGLYEQLAGELVTASVTVYRLGARRPDVFIECVGDVLAGLSFLKGIGAGRVALVGHSFNGAVAIKAAAFSDLVVGVAALAAQTYGAQDVAEIAPRHLLVVHGQADEVLPYTDAQRIYDWAKEPKELVLYPGANHGLREVKDQLHDKLKAWLLERIGPEGTKEKGQA